MFKHSKEITRNMNSCRCELNSGLVLSKGSTIKEVTSAICIVDLLSIQELQRYTNLGSKTLLLEALVENVIVKDKVKEVLGFDGYSIEVNRSPAGSIANLSYMVYLKSKLHLIEPEQSYREQEATITMVDKMASIISYYMNIPFQEVLQLPVNEIYKRYAIVAHAFPSQVNDPFAVEEEVLE